MGHNTERRGILMTMAGAVVGLLGVWLLWRQASAFAPSAGAVAAGWVAAVAGAMTTQAGLVAVALGRSD